MPTSYTPTLPSKPEREVRPRPQIFQPPRTPASTASTPYACGNDRADRAISSSRKRSRPESTSDYFTTPYSASANGWSNVSAESSIQRSAGLESPAPMVNTRYMLAGGLDTPSLAAEASYDRNDFADRDFRRRWSVGSTQEDALLTLGPLARERNGKRKAASTLNSTTTRSWGEFMFTFVGGVAGRMWDFCRGSAFRGFYAGGGQGYDIKHVEGEGITTSDLWDDAEESQLYARDSTPIPGQFPPDDYAAMQQPPLDDTTPPRPTKRLHTDSGADWVLVSRASSPRLPTRKTPTLSSLATNHSHSHNNHNHKSHIPLPTPSRAPSRRSLIPVSRRAASTVSCAGSPALHHHHPVTRPASFAPARSPIAAASSPTMTTKKQASPPSAEAQRYKARMLRREREAEAGMWKVNEQLRAMIREGREALGARVEVVDGGRAVEDEGDAEGCFDYGGRGGGW